MCEPLDQNRLLRLYRNRNIDYGPAMARRICQVTDEAGAATPAFFSGDQL